MNSSHCGIGQQTVSRRVTLNELVNPSTQSFLHNTGLQKGMNVLDLNCGIGAMSCWIAEQVGPEGMVIAINNNQAQIDVAKQLADESGIHNIEFIKLELEDIPNIPTRFDLVYSRFLLIHLKNPEEIIQSIYSRLEPGGIFACESAILGHEFCYPIVDAFERWRELNHNAFKLFNKDPQTGKKLYSMMHKAGFHDLSAKIYQPVLSSAEQKREMLVNDLIDQAETFVQYELATEKEISGLKQELEALAQSNEHFIAYCQSCQVMGVK